MESFYKLCRQNADLMGIFCCKAVDAAAHPSYNTRLFCLPTFIGNIMVVIRLSRGGAKKRPFFNIVATDSRNRRDGRFIERIGFYNPIAAGGEVAFSVAQDRLAYWQGVGAQLSPTVARLVDQAPKAAA
jgi:small subunit ribosomal protein S16